MNDIDCLGKTVEAFCEFVKAQPDGSNPEGWGSHEVLAHLVYHHESYVAQVRTRMDGSEYEPLDGKWREINAQAVNAFRDTPNPELLRRFRAANQELTRLYRCCKPARIRMDLKRGSKRRTLAELIPEVEAHIRNHQRKLTRPGR